MNWLEKKINDETSLLEGRDKLWVAFCNQIKAVVNTYNAKYGKEHGQIICSLFGDDLTLTREKFFKNETPNQLGFTRNVELKLSMNRSGSEITTTGQVKHKILILTSSGATSTFKGDAGKELTIDDASRFLLEGFTLGISNKII